MSMSMLKKKILVVSPHYDDEVLSCGGLLQKGSDVTVVFLCGRSYDHAVDAVATNSAMTHSEEARQLLDYGHQVHLGFDDEVLADSATELHHKLEDVCRDVGPDVVVLPWMNDVHQDHRTAFDVGQVVFRGVDTILCGFVPSCTDLVLSGLQFQANLFLELTHDEVLKKARALECYVDECRRRPSGRSVDGIFHSAGSFGAGRTDSGFAEPYVMLKGVIRD